MNSTNKQIKSIAAVSCAALTALGADALAASTTSKLNPVHDAYLDNGKLHNSNELRVENGRRTSYLKFNLAEIEGTIESIKLVMTVGSDPGNGKITISQANTANWNETSLTQRNAPTILKALTTASGVMPRERKVSFNIDEAKVKNSKLSLIVTMERGGNDVSFASKEAGNKAPQLIVTYKEADTDIPVTAIRINEAPITFSEVRATKQLTASVEPVNATNKTIKWSSSRPSVATVDSKGLVTAIDDGTSIITAESENDKVSSISVKVETLQAGDLETINFEDLRTKRVESDSSYYWKQFGPGMSGNNYRIYTHPTDENVAFLGPNMGVSYRTTNKGYSWKSVLDADGGGYNRAERGPAEIGSPDFSRQDGSFGFCTKEDGTFLFTTENKGKTWERHYSSDSVWNGMELNAIAVDPSDDQIWYVGSGNAKELNLVTYNQANPHSTGATSNHKAKIWKTDDQGDSWTDITPPASKLNSKAQIIRILVHPKKSNIVFAATTYGFYKSTDGGKNWFKKTDGLDSNIIRSMDMHYNPTTKKTVLFVVDQVKWKPAKSRSSVRSNDTVANDGGGIFRSTDNGETWECINGDIAVDISQLADIALFKNSYYRALDKWFGTSNASSQYKVFPKQLLQGLTVVRVDPNNPKKIFVLNDYKHKGNAAFSAGMLWRTDNGGAHWYPALRNGTAWEGKHKDYWLGRCEAAHGNDLSVDHDPIGHNIGFRGQYEWEERSPYEVKAGGDIAFTADSSRILFQWAKVFCISKDGGDTWQENDEVEATPGTRNYVGMGNSNMPGHGLRQDPRFPNDVFCPGGENDFWVTTDDGDNVYEGALAAHRVSLGHGEFSCSDIAFDPKNTNIIYSLQFRQENAGDLLRSTDGGATFEPHGKAMPWPRGESTNDQIHQICLTIDPDYRSEKTKHMYFCVPKSARHLEYTMSIAKQFGVRKSTDGGKTWEWSNSGLPSNPDVPCITMDPNDSKTLYACVYGSNGGLYKSIDKASTWTKVNGLSRKGVKSVLDLHIAQDGKMYASCGLADGDWKIGGVWMSPDNGATWTQIFEMPWARMTKTAAYDPSVILVQMNAGKRIKPIVNPGTYLSKDGGKTWSKINKGNPQSDRVNAIAIDQVKEDVFYTSTYGAGWLRATLK